MVKFLFVASLLFWVIAVVILFLPGQIVFAETQSRVMSNVLIMFIMASAIFFALALIFFYIVQWLGKVKE